MLNGAQQVTAPYGVSTRDGVERLTANGSQSLSLAQSLLTLQTTKATSPLLLITRLHTAPNADAGASARATRDQKLTASDWTQMADSPLSDSDKTAWAVYRQSLRDLPTASGFPHTMTWPEEPGS